MRFSFLTALLVLMPLPAATASPMPGASSGAPLEITADTALEWHRDARQYVAKTNAKAVQGDFSVSADTLTADYDDSKGSTAITQLTAAGHVTIISGESRATGDHAIYDIVAGKAVMTGGNLKLSGANLSVTAKDKFEYYVTEGKLVAYGRPVITSGANTLEADQATAWINRDKKTAAAGAMGGDLRRAAAYGHVFITMPQESATGDQATYDGATNLANLTGHAHIKSAKGTLDGEHAEMNLSTKVSRMVGGANARVKGVFYPAQAQPAADKS